MAFSHGVTASEKQFAPLAARPNRFTTVIAVGTAPVNMSTLAVPPVNTPIRVNTRDEAVAKFGYSEDWESFTLCEVIESHFTNYKQSPLILINVMDPAVHVESVASSVVGIVKGRATLPDDGIIMGTLTVKSADGTTTYVKGTDYTASYDVTGKVLIISRNGGSIPTSANSISVSYDKLDASVVDATSIIGGADPMTGVRTGIELVEEVYPRFQLVPDVLIAPGFSDQRAVASAMVSKGQKVNGVFETIAITDLDASKNYLEIVDWKNDNGYRDPLQINAYPMAKYAGRIYHMSTIIAGTKATVDAGNDGVPAESPSNKRAMIDALVYADGTEMYLGKEQADMLNSNGIVTAINFTGQYNVWGNRTAAYPDYTDPQRSFIPVRATFSWAKNNFITQYWSRVDSLMNNRNIGSVVDDANVWLNGLGASGYLLGGVVSFDESENPIEELLNGKAVFKFRMTPPNPMEAIEGKFEYDTSYFAALFA